MKRIIMVFAAVVLSVSCARPAYPGGCSGCEIWLPLLGIELLTLGVWAANNPQYYDPYPEKSPVPHNIYTPHYNQPYNQPEARPAYPGFWYYCRNPEGYYPDVSHCPGGWEKVVPSGPRRQPVEPPRD